MGERQTGNPPKRIFLAPSADVVVVTTAADFTLPPYQRRAREVEKIRPVRVLAAAFLPRGGPSDDCVLLAATAAGVILATMCPGVRPAAPDRRHPTPAELGARVRIHTHLRRALSFLGGGGGAAGGCDPPLRTPPF